jgi:hypothetical protein
MEVVVMQFDGIEMREEGEMWVEQMKSCVKEERELEICSAPIAKI